MRELPLVPVTYTDQTPLATMTPVHHETASQTAVTVHPIETPIQFSELTKLTLFRTQFVTGSFSEVQALPLDIVNKILRLLTGRDLWFLSRLSRGYNRLFIGHRYRTSQSYLAKPPNIGWQCLDYLSYSEILSFLDINDSDPLATLIKQYIEVTRECRGFHYWKAALDDPSLASFESYIKDFYGLTGVSFDTCPALIQLYDASVPSPPNEPDRLEELENSIATFVVSDANVTPPQRIFTGGVVATAQALNDSKFTARTFSDIAKQKDKTDLKALLTLVIKLKKEARDVERRIDTIILSIGDPTKIIEKFPPAHEVIRSQFTDFLSLLRQAPFVRRMSKQMFCKLYLIRRPLEAALLNIFISSEYRHLLFGFSEEDINELAKKYKDVIHAINAGIVNRNKLLLDKLNASFLCWFAKYGARFAKLILDCDELRLKLSKQQLNEIEEIYTRYHIQLELLTKKKQELEALANSVSLSGAERETPLLQLIDQYKALSEWHAANPMFTATYEFNFETDLSSLFSECLKIIRQDHLDNQSLQELKAEVRSRIDGVTNEIQRIVNDPRFYTHINGAKLSSRKSALSSFIPEYCLNSLDNLSMISHMTREYWAMRDKYYEEMVAIDSLLAADKSLSRELIASRLTDLSRDIPENPKVLVDKTDADIQIVLQRVSDNVGTMFTSIIAPIDVPLTLIRQAEQGYLSPNRWNSQAQALNTLESKLSATITQIEMIVNILISMNRRKIDPSKNAANQLLIDEYSKKLTEMKKLVGKTDRQIEEIQGEVKQESEYLKTAMISSSPAVNVVRSLLDQVLVQPNNSSEVQSRVKLPDGVKNK
jgi:hypothetical protein